MRQDWAGILPLKSPMCVSPHFLLFLLPSQSSLPCPLSVLFSHICCASPPQHVVLGACALAQSGKRILENYIIGYAKEDIAVCRQSFENPNSVLHIHLLIS